MVYWSYLRDIAVALVVSTQMYFVSGPPSPSASLVQTSRTTVVADGAARTTLSVLLRDAFGNVVTDANVMFADSAAHALFSASPCTTDANGLCTQTLASTEVGVHLIDVSALGVAIGQTQVTFVVGPPSASTSSFTVSTLLQTAGASDGITATLVLQDAAGHLLDAIPTRFTASSASVSVTGDGATSPLGIATATYQSIRAQGVTLNAAAGGLTWSAAAAFAPGPPNAAACTLSVSPASLVADGASTAQVVLTSRDINGNATAGTAVSLSASGSAHTWGSPTGLTDASGMWTTTLSSTQVQIETVTASLDANVLLSAPVRFVAGPPSSLTSSLAAGPWTQIADGNKTIVATLTLRDSGGHPLTGVQPSFAASGSLTTLTAAAVTDANGQSSTALASTLAQNENVHVWAGSVSLAIPIRFVPGPVASSFAWLAVSPNTLLADGNTTAVLTARLADNNNNAIAGQSVAFFASGNPVSLSSVAAISNAQGMASTTLSSVFSGPRHLFAEAQNVTLNASLSSTARTTSLCVANPNYGLVNITPPAVFGAMLVADFNNDGKSDIAVAGANQVSVFWGTVTGFTAVGTAFAAGGTPAALAAGDVNGDGYADLVSLNAGGTLSVLLNLGTTLFAPPAAYALNANASALVLDDFNGDGRLDVALALTSTTNAAAVLMGTGLGQLGPVVLWPAAGPASGLTTLDYNQDGVRDVALTQSSRNSVLPMLGQGDGSVSVQTSIATGSGPKDVRAGDFNQDGIDDLVLVHTGANTLGVLLGTGHAAFRTITSYPLGTAPSSLVLDDLNGDSLPDVITLSALDKTYSVMLGAANGAFGLRLIYAVGSTPTSLSTGDFNRDGYRDVVVANGSVPSLSLYAYNSCVNALGALLGPLLPTQLGG